MESSQKNQKRIVGIDEAGRGPLAGPVAVGCVSVCRKNLRKLKTHFPDFRDSKKLSEKSREKYLQKIRELRDCGVLDFCVVMKSASLIDRKGIVVNIREAIKTGLKKLDVDGGESRVLLDGGLKAPEAFRDQQTIVRGDEKELMIALASVVAKVTRDEKMRKFARQYPGYEFEKHKGYGTKAHFQNLEKFGMSEIHRRSFLRKFGNIDNLNK